MKCPGLPIVIDFSKGGRSTVKDQFFELNAWIGKRLRCMKYKRISKGDNRCFPNKRFACMGLVSLYSIATVA